VCSRRSRLAVAASGAGIVLSLAATPTHAAAATLRGPIVQTTAVIIAPVARAHGVPRGAIAGYNGTDPLIAQLQATIIVPRIVCHSGQGVTEIDVVIANKEQGASGGIEIGCQGQHRATYVVVVVAGGGGAVVVPAEKVRPGIRVRFTLADRFHRMSATATIARRRPIHMSAKARPATTFAVGAAVEGGEHVVLRGPIRVGGAMLNRGPLGSAAILVRTSEIHDSRTLLRASPLRRGKAFTITQP
jgi:hypothetical protein